ncbi:MAG TPA: tRNA (guanosine(37)-N1)-methyltransferase TrmD [Planctomycetota bacterium]|nr:tRNA (guanosine(37)-N1)-methyltransferase TrmD [Planctomycetota bacterium]
MLLAILTLFPEALEAYARESILGIAQEKGLVTIMLVDFRDFARDRHRTVDDRPFGGGPGMVLRPEPIVECVEWLEARHGRFHRFALCPRGRTFTQRVAEEIAREERVLLLCGRYEGFDERVREELELEDLSIGDYVLSGGELPALVVAEAVARLVPGVLGDERSALQDSFREGGPLDYPHYTRPREFRGRAVPEVLLSGDHEAIERWRRSQALETTRSRRPDLLERETPSETADRTERAPGARREP